MSKLYVLFDCDGGSDDAWALLLLLKATTELQSRGKHIEFLGITISGCGNTDAYNAARNMLRVLRSCDRNDIPIYCGAKNSILSTEAREGYLFHGVDGFGNILPNDISDDEINNILKTKHAVNVIKEFCQQHYQQVHLIAVGPLTNIALCYATYGDEFAKSVASLYVMGGNYQGVGNWTRAAEFNFHADAEAAQIVLERSQCPLFIVPWETCINDEFDVDLNWRFDYIGKRANSYKEAINLLDRVENAQWSKTNYKFWTPCDLFIVMAFFFYEDFVVKQSCWHATVDLNGKHTRGQMVLDHLHCVEKNPENLILIERFDQKHFKNIVAWLAGLEELELQFSTKFN